MDKATRPHILVLPPPTLYRKLFSPETDARLRELGTITYNGDERDLTRADLVERIGPADVVIMGWRCPPFTYDVLDAAPRLKLIASSAGSVSYMLYGGD